MTRRRAPGPRDLAVLADRMAEVDTLAAAGARPVEIDCEAAGRVPFCYGCALTGPEACYEFNLPPEVHAACVDEARQLAGARSGQPCHDCAFLPGSPERREEDMLERLIRSAKPFRCHQAMPLDGRGRVPALGDFAPLDPDAYPVCAGWARARAALLLRLRARDALRKIRRPPTQRERWYANLGLRSWRPCRPQPRHVPTGRVIDPLLCMHCNTRRRRQLRAALRVERQREVWLGGERVGRILCSGGSYRVEDQAGAGPRWIFGAPSLALDAFAVWLVRQGRRPPLPAPPRPPEPPPKQPLPPGRPPSKRRRWRPFHCDRAA